MRPNLILLAECALTGGIALALGITWMAVTGQDTIPVPIGIAAAGVSVAASLGADQAVLAVRRRRARTGPARHRKGAA